MNYPLLNTHRGVVFNPCYCAGDEITTNTANAASVILGLAHGNPKGDGIKLVRNTPMGEAYAMLAEAGAHFNLIVSEPPTGMTPLKGLPKPQKMLSEMPKPAGRKLFLDSAEAAPQADQGMDLGYATFLVTNALLSSFGEAMLVVNRESHALIEKDAQYSRVWCVAAESEGRVRLYIARDHRPLPGSGINYAQDRRKIRGNVVTPLSGLGNPDVLRKFNAVRDELQRRSVAQFDEWNIFLDNNRLKSRFSQFAIESKAVSAALVQDVQLLLYGKTMLDLAVMRDTRDRTTAILKNKQLKIPPDLLKAWEDTCRQIAVLAAPFARPSPVQRVAWLDEQDTIQCTRTFGPFEAGKSYHVTTQVITGKKLELRHRPGHSAKEEVLVTGQEVAVFLSTQHERHVFTQFPITEKMQGLHWQYVRPKCAHTLEDLITNFAMPEVQDIAEADTASYLKYRNRLEKLQTA